MLRHYRPYREGLDSCEGNILLSSCIFVHVLLYVHFEPGWLKIDLITLWCVGCAHAGTTACTTHLWLPISASSCLFMTHWATQPTASHGTSINRSVLVQVGLHFISCVPSSSPCISPGTQLIMLLTLLLAQLLHAYSFNYKWLLHVYIDYDYTSLFCYTFSINTYLHTLWVYIYAGVNGKRVPDFVFLAHVVDVTAALHVPFVLRSFSSQPFKTRLFLFPLWPLTFVVMLLMWAKSKTFLISFYNLGGRLHQTWAVPRFGFQVL